MTKEISWIVTAKIKTSDPAAFESLMNEMVSMVQEKQSDTLTYVWYLSEDGRAFQVFATFRDSSAAIVYLDWMTKNYRERINEIADPTSIAVYGKVSQELRTALRDLLPSYLLTIGGFVRSN